MTALVMRHTTIAVTTPTLEIILIFVSSITPMAPSRLDITRPMAGLPSLLTTATIATMPRVRSIVVSSNLVVTQTLYRVAALTQSNLFSTDGFAWAEDENDPSYVYRGNNLFFVSLFDHMYTRGYVSNIAGAPMCACAEQMPTVSRSDCTQIDFESEY